MIISSDNTYTYIYYDPATMMPFYVGKGINTRAYDHLTESIENTNNPEKIQEIQRILETGMKPIIKICYKATEDEAFELEEFLTHFWELRHKGGILTNKIYGGKNGNFVGLEGLPKSEEHKNKISKETKKYNDAHPEKWEKFKKQQRKGAPKKKSACNKMSATKKALYQDHPEQHPRLGKKQSAHSIQVSSDFNSNTWEITFPDQHKEIIKNLKKFCKEHNNINHGNLSRGSASGYKAINLDPKKYKKRNQKTKDAISHALAKRYEITFPDQHKEEITNFSKWCEKNGLYKSDFYCGGNTKGFSVRKLPDCK